MRRILQYLGIETSANEPLTIYYDNQATIAYTKDHKYHKKPNLIHIILHYIITRQMMADPLSKPIGQDVYKSNVIAMRFV